MVEFKTKELLKIILRYTIVKFLMNSYYLYGPFIKMYNQVKMLITENGHCTIHKVLYIIYYVNSMLCIT